MSFCLKRSRLVSTSLWSSFPRYYAARSNTNVDTDTPAKKRVRNAPTRSMLQGTKVQDHLSEIAATSGKVVLADIERLRPLYHARAGTQTYAEQYTQLLEKITTSFTVPQMRQFLKLYDIHDALPAEARRQKLQCAMAIVEQQWGWPSLAAIQDRERAAEMSTETFPLTPTQAFLILGKDGAETRALSIRHHCRMSFLANPLSLQVEGTVGSLKQLGIHIAELKASIAQEYFEVPAGRTTRNEVLNRISRLSGALAESSDVGKICISFLKTRPNTCVVAKRLIAQAFCEEHDTKHGRLLFHLPPSIPSSSALLADTTFPNSYALYPFLSPRSFPWSAGAGGVFRLRRVEDWLGTGASEDLKKTGGLLMGRGHLLTLQQEDADLKALLLPDSVPSAFKTVVASIGHLLVTSNVRDQRSIVPPLQGHWKIPHILNWMEKLTDPVVFAPSLPNDLLHSPRAQHQMLHRLFYRAAHTGDAHWVKIEIILPRSTKEATLAPETSESELPAYHSSCSIGQQTNLDVMMPDRPADIRFSVLDSQTLLAGQWPPVLEEYASNLRAFLSYQDPDASQPEPPITLEHEGIHYMLQSSSTVRRKVEQPDHEHLSSVQVVAESALDLDGEQKSTSCQITCTDIKSEAGWKSFLRQCDSMSATAPPASNPKHAAPLF